MKKTAKRPKYPDGVALLPGDEDPSKKAAAKASTTPPASTSGIDPKALRTKYASNPYLVGENNRYFWATQADRQFPYSPGQTPKTAVLAAAKANNVDPALLYASAMEEGMSGSIDTKNFDQASTAYVDWTSKNKDLASKFPVDSFYNYGLDQFAGQAASLEKKGYLPKGFSQNFTTFDAQNEKKENIKASAFNNDANAIMAKSAMMRQAQDQLNNYAKTKGYNLTPEQQQFFTLANYNGGEGNMQGMLDSYNQKGYLKNNDFLKTDFTPASYGSIYKNVQARIQSANMLRGEKIFGYGGTMPKRPKYQDGTTLDPITGEPVNDGLKNATNMGQDVWKNASNSQVPINPQAPQNQQIFKVDNKGDVVQQQAPIVPLSQFYDESKDNFGNTQLTGTGHYVDDQGNINTQAQQQQRNNEISLSNLENANRKEKTLNDAEKVSALGITAINAFFNKKEQAQLKRTQQRKAIMQEQFAPLFNPYAEGTGSQAIFKSGGSIHIDPKNKGKFNATKKRTGKSTEELTHSSNALTRKRAIFAQNARKWNHGEFGLTLDKNDDHTMYNEVISHFAGGGHLNFKSAGDYHRWLGYVHATGLAESTPGSQEVSIKGQHHDVDHSMASGGGLSREDDYGSKKKPYPSVAAGDFAGGGRSYPIPTRADAVDALRLAHLHGRSDVIAKVHAKYPDLKGEEGLDLEPDTDEDDMQITDGGKAKQISSDDNNPMFEFKGKTHAEGGIGIQFGGKVAEVEDDEVGMVGQDGTLNIFGKMKVPGTNKTFKKAAKDMAEAELKTDKKKAYYSAILGNSSNTDKYQETARSTAKVMLGSLEKQAGEIDKDKEALADYQKLVLALAGKGENNMKYGGSMPKRPNYIKGKEGLSIDPEDVSGIQAIIDKYSGGKSPLKAEDFIEVSKKYNVPLDLMLAQAIQESNFGTAGRAVRTRNMFNVGNDDAGRENTQQDWKQGLELYAKTIKDYGSTTAEILNNDFIRPGKGGRYASDKNYTNNVRRVLGDIGSPEYAGKTPKGNFHMGQNDDLGTGAVDFNPEDAMSLYKWILQDDEHPLNPKNQPNDYYKSTFKDLQQYLGLAPAGGPGDDFKQFKGKDGKSYTSPKGLKPSVFYKDPSIAEALKKDQTFPKAADDAVWGPEHQKLWESLSEAKKAELLGVGGNNNVNTDFKPKYDQIQQVDPTKDTQYGKAYRDPTTFKDKVNIGTGDRARGYLSPLAIEQIAPELLTVATNRREAVPQLSYQPELKQTFDISYQLGRNENQAGFNQAAKIAEQTGNVGAVADLAAALYKSNESYNMQEVQGNAQQKLQTYNQNVDTLNDAKLKNLQLIDTQFQRQSQADFNTRKEDIAAFTSVAGKELQNKLENKTYNAYANLFQHYGFDKRGNVTFNPDDVVQKFNAGEAQQFGMLAAQKGVQDIMSKGTKTATTYDDQGNIKKVTSIDSDLEEFNTIWNSKNLDESQKKRILENRKNPIYKDLENQ